MPHPVTTEFVGNVTLVYVTVGDPVGAGDTLVVLESMTSEVPVLADIDGVVAEVAVRAGQAIRAGEVIAVIETPEQGD